MHNYTIGIIVLTIIIILLLIFMIPDYLSTITVPKISLPIINSKSEHIVPKLIHRTWYSNTMSKCMYDTAYEPWIKLNPSYTMIWYDDEDVEVFMKNYGAREYRAFKKLICTAYKMDLFRLLKLYDNGGLYVDSYAVPHISIDDMILRSGLSNETELFISILDCELVAADAIHNGLMIVTPKHPFIRQAIKDVLDNIDIGIEEASMSMTGPRALSKSIHRCLKHKIPHKIGLNNHRYKYYLFEFPFSLYQHIYDKNKIIFRKKMDLLYCLWYQRIYKYLLRDKSNYIYASSIGKVCYTDEELYNLYKL